MRAHRILPLLLPLALLASACGGEDTPELTDAEYFGLTTGQCWLFEDDTGFTRVTVGVESETDALGFPAVRLRYRIGGNLRRTDYVSLADGEARIHRREEPVTSDTWSFDPGILWMQRPVAPTGSAPLVTQTSAAHETRGESTWEVEVAVNSKADVETADGGTLQASPVFMIVDDGNGIRQDQAWVVPYDGFVQLDLAGSEWPLVRLVTRWTMEEGDTTCVPPDGA